MDVPKAMSILGFSGARHFDSTSLPEIEKKFTLRIHALEQYKGPSGSKYDMRRSYSPSPLKVGMGGPLYSFNPGRGYEEVQFLKNYSCASSQNPRDLGLGDQKVNE